MGKGRRPMPGTKPPNEKRPEPKVIHRKITISFEVYRPGAKFCLAGYADRDVRESFLDGLRKLCERTWQQLLESASKEKGQKAGLNPTIHASNDLKGVSLPDSIAPDVSIVRFRATQRRRIIGARIDNIFFVLWFDEDHEIIPE